jgi:hypothetical protein
LFELSSLGRLAMSTVVLGTKTGVGGAPFVGEVGRPGWPRAPPWLDFPPARSFLLHDFLARVLHELHRPNALVHSFTCIIGPYTLCFMLCVMYMLPCSTCFTCHHEFPAKLCFLPAHACPLHVVLMKVVERASNGACMINFN